MSRRTRILLIVLGVAALVRIALPYALAAVIERQGTLALGRPVEVEDVYLSLTGGHVTLEGLVAGAADAPRLECERIHANVHFLNLLRGRAQLEALEIGTARLALGIEADGSLVPVAVLAEAEEPVVVPVPEVDEEAPIEEPGSAWPLLVDRLAIDDVSFLLVPVGEEGAAPLEVSLEELSLQDFSLVDGDLGFGAIGLRSFEVDMRRDLTILLPQAEEATVGAAAEEVAPAEPLGVAVDELRIDDARFTLDLGDTDLELALDLLVSDVRMDRDARFPVELRLGREEGWIELAGEAGANPPGFRGDLELVSVDLSNLVRAANPETALRIERGSVDGKLAIDAALGEAGLSAALDGELTITEARLVSEGRAFDTARARLTTGGARLTAREGDARFAADRVGLDAEGIAFLDESVEPSALVELLELNATLGGVRWPDRDLRLDLGASGIAMEFRLEGELEGGSGATELHFSDFPLHTVSGYSAAAGVSFQGGQGSLEGTLESAGAHHTADLVLGLQEVVFESVDEGVFQSTFGMSADLALGILADPTGRIELPLTFEFDEADGDAEIGLGAILAGATRQTLVGIVSSPFKGLGLAKNAVLGDEGEVEIDPVLFEAGEDEWLEEEEHYLDALGRSLVQRPGLRLRLVGRASPDETRNPEKLARKRAEAVSRALVERGVDPTLVGLADPETGEPGVGVEVLPRAE